MKRKFLSFLLLPCLLLGLSACDDDSGNPSQPQNPDDKPITSVSGAFVACYGQMTNGIPGSISSLNLEKGTTTLNAFATVNGRNVGAPNDAVVYGNNLYIVSTDENTIEVVNRKTMRSVASISTVTLMGDDKGAQPRCLACGNGRLFVSTYAGYVAEIETTAFQLTRTFQVGSYPEGMAFIHSQNGRGELWVANSDYGNGKSPSLSRIDLENGNVEIFTFSNLKNPKSVYYVANQLYVLDGGDYDASWNQQNAALYLMSGQQLIKVTDATMAAADNNRIYICNAPFHTPVLTPTYSIYDVRAHKLTLLPDVSVDSPAFIGVNPLTGNIFIGSYYTDPEYHYALYNQNGYVREFTREGEKVRDYECGVGPVTIAFNYN